MNGIGDGSEWLLVHSNGDTTLVETQTGSSLDKIATLQASENIQPPNSSNRRPEQHQVQYGIVRSQRTLRVLYNYTATEDNELSVTAGEVVSLVEPQEKTGTDSCFFCLIHFHP